MWNNENSYKLKKYVISHFCYKYEKQCFIVLLQNVSYTFTFYFLNKKRVMDLLENKCTMIERIYELTFVEVFLF